MTKRFKDTACVWTQYGLFLMKQGRPDAARKILEKSLKAVNRKERKNECTSWQGGLVGLESWFIMLCSVFKATITFPEYAEERVGVISNYHMLYPIQILM